jgi:hypothetical protein
MGREATTVTRGARFPLVLPEEPRLKPVQTNWNWTGSLLSFTAVVAVVWAIYRTIDEFAEIEFRDGLDLKLGSLK